MEKKKKNQLKKRENPEIVLLRKKIKVKILKMRRKVNWKKC